MFSRSSPSMRIRPPMGAPVRERSVVAGEEVVERDVLADLVLHLNSTRLLKDSILASRIPFCS